MNNASGVVQDTSGAAAGPIGLEQIPPDGLAPFIDAEVQHLIEMVFVEVLDGEVQPPGAMTDRKKNGTAKDRVGTERVGDYLSGMCRDLSESRRSRFCVEAAAAGSHVPIPSSGNGQSNMEPSQAFDG
jgi:hypothetical protein